MRTVGVREHGVQTHFECHWTEYVPPIWILLILYIKTRFVNQSPEVFPKCDAHLIVFVCVTWVGVHPLCTGNLYAYVITSGSIAYCDFK